MHVATRLNHFSWQVCFLVVIPPVMHEPTVIPLIACSALVAVELPVWVASLF